VPTTVIGRVFEWKMPDIDSILLQRQSISATSDMEPHYLLQAECFGSIVKL